MISEALARLHVVLTEVHLLERLRRVAQGCSDSVVDDLHAAHLNFRAPHLSAHGHGDERLPRCEGWSQLHTTCTM